MYTEKRGNQSACYYSALPITTTSYTQYRKRKRGKNKKSMHTLSTEARSCPVCNYNAKHNQQVHQRRQTIAINTLCNTSAYNEPLAGGYDAALHYQAKTQHHYPSPYFPFDQLSTNRTSPREHWTSAPDLGGWWVGAGV